MAEALLNLASRLSVVEQEPKDTPGGYDLGWLFGLYRQPSDLLPEWGTGQRALALNSFYYTSYGTLMQGAIAQMVKRVASTPYELVGDEKDAERFQEVFQGAEFGLGFDVFLEKLITDFLVYDFGGVFEIVGPGSPNSELKTGAVVGMNHLDSLRCVPTGNREFPLMYWSRKTNKLHRLHRSRVYRLIDMPTGNENYYNNGLSSLSRMISVANAQYLMAKYQNEKLSDLPMSGMLAINGLSDTQWRQALDGYKNANRADGNDVFRNLMTHVSANPNAPVKFELTPFASLPDNFNYRDYMEVHVNLVALALGDDPQNIWPLTGAPMGTGTQSKMLHLKSQGKTFGMILTKLERALNICVLPKDMEFKWKHKDVEADKERADTAQVWINIANGATFLNDVEKRQLVANNVEALADVLLDPDGRLRLPDDDPKDPAQIVAEVTADDNATLDTQEGTAPGGDGDVASIVNAASAAKGYLDRRQHDPVVLKGFEATRSDFIKALADTIAASSSDDLSRTRAGTVMRGHLRSYGLDAYRDGLADGGVEERALSDDDQDSYNTILVEQSGYVKAFLDSIYKDGVQIVEFESKATQWANKSLQAFYNGGLLSADANGIYIWRIGDTETHCDDCKRFDGKKARYKDWMESGWHPKSNQLKCHGDFCDCELKRSRGSATISLKAMLKAA